MKSNLSATLSLVLFIAAVTTTTQGAGVVLGETTWTAGNGHSYAIVEFPEETWASASADILVTLPGYHLATITSQAEQDFVWAYLTQIGGAGVGDFWLGGFQDIEPETDPAAGWMWVTGEPWIYTNWDFGEPNDAGGIEDHLVMQGGFGGAGNDEGTARGVVQGYIAEVVPIPPALWLFASGLIGLVGIARRRKQS